MEFDFIIKIIIYVIIVRIIMSKVKKNKNKNKNIKSDRKENSTPKTSTKQRRTGIQEKQEVKKDKSNLDLTSFKDLLSKPEKPLSPDERMRQREKELENRNKR